MAVDITITGTGFFSINSVSPVGSDWVHENVQDAESFGDITVAYTDSQHMAQDIAESATKGGLAVIVNGYIYLPGGLRGEIAA